MKYKIVSLRFTLGVLDGKTSTEYLNAIEALNAAHEIFRGCYDRSILFTEPYTPGYVGGEVHLFYRRKELIGMVVPVEVA